MEYTDLFLKFVEQGGPLVGILLPILEAFVPILPLVGFVIINVGIFGFVWGYIYSWIGSCIGSFLLFLFIKRVGAKKIDRKIEQSKYQGTLDKIREENFSVLFILYCFPFTPSFLISGTAALSNMNTKKFLVALIPAKLIMMVSLSFVGVNVKSFFKKPIKSVAFVVIIILFNLLCKKIINEYEKTHRKS
jgi:uncharacterized membrane protein YdjX (TVP38/TMEM64 family)